MGVHIREKPKGSGVWWVDVVHHGQRIRKRVGKGRDGKLAAKKAAIEIQLRLAVGGGDLSTLVRSPGPAPTFAALAEEWVRRYPALHAIRPNTWESYQTFLTHHLLPYFGQQHVSSITTDTIEAFIECKRAPGGSVRRHGKPLGDRTLRSGLVVLSLILKRAVRMKLIPTNPMRDVEWGGGLSQRTQSVDPFTVPELQAIFGAAGHQDSDFATLLRLWAQSGMREGEVLGLQHHDLDLGTGKVLVRRTWSRERLGPTKTGLERQVSFLHPVADETLEWRPGTTPEACSVLRGIRQLKVTSLDPTAFVFGRGDRPMSARELRYKWHRVLATAKVRYRPPEQLRHTLASTLLSRNAPLLYVQHQGGWRSANVLLRVYARWLPQDPIEAPIGTLLSPPGVAKTAK
jgi:integrase